MPRAGPSRPNSGQKPNNPEPETTMDQNQISIIPDQTPSPPLLELPAGSSASSSSGDDEDDDASSVSSSSSGEISISSFGSEGSGDNYAPALPAPIAGVKASKEGKGKGKSKLMGAGGVLESTKKDNKEGTGRPTTNATGGTKRIRTKKSKQVDQDEEGGGKGVDSVFEYVLIYCPRSSSTSAGSELE